MDQQNDIIIRVEHVSKLYGINKSEATKMMAAGSNKDEVYKKTGCTVALWDVNLTIPRGKIFVIIGLSGSGKSTLVRCFNRLNRPTMGKVFFDGRDLSELDKKELLEFRRSKISMVFQSFGLMSHRDVMGNVAYGLEVRGMGKAEREQKAMEVISMVGLEGWEHRGCDQLSGGMRQRVGIARALANDPEILISDEATSALDPQTTKSILQLLKELNRKLGITIVVITHEMQVVKEICSQVYVMDGGRVVESGDVFQVFSYPQKEITRSFVASTSNLSRIDDLLRDPGHPIRLAPGDYLVRLRYLERSSSVALISHISRTYEINMNILLGDIELIDGDPLGGLVAIASGDHDSITAAMGDLSGRNVLVEVIARG